MICWSGRSFASNRRQVEGYLCVSGCVAILVRASNADSAKLHQISHSIKRYDGVSYHKQLTVPQTNAAELTCGTFSDKFLKN
jgi:hypothetical protein